MVWPSIIGAPYVPTPKESVRKMLELANVNQGDFLVDLGSGDGRVIIMAAEEFGATALGIEADPIRVKWSRYQIRKRHLEEMVDVVWGNFFSQSLERATVVFVYQGDDVNQKLKLKLLNELQPGTRLVTYCFPFDGWDPVEITKKPNLYLYKV
jgi:precorrin-6B methylase 2